MSWSNVVPLWVLCVEYEEHQAKMLGAFPEELKSGYTRSLPEHVVKIIQREKELDMQEEGVL